MEMSSNQTSKRRARAAPENAQLDQSAEDRIISVIRAENQELRESIETLKKNVALLCETVSSQTQLIKLLYNQPQETETSQNGPPTDFPIKTEDDLLSVDKNMNPATRVLYVKEMVNIFRHAPLSKSLKKVLAVDLVVDFNVDGTQNKKSLRTYENFFSALLEAVKLADSTQPPEKALRKAMQCVKNSACKRRTRFLKELS
ncbi:uncharacterized protein LOC119557597 isoform X1 [Drosophila subpulchrella]|uniref:uncharacterized protein LOC119557597 isoform X1 n=1 Tax=Drosophila subpulchrella TaxID=1486046 RepID=UPI0018A1A2A9|nr:uncharacterized protein LOC119557597 isoform X1 [Drosophila subpulchrella]